MSQGLVFPGALYGPVDGVRRSVADAIAMYSAGQPWDVGFGTDFVAVNTAPGLIVMNGPAPMLAGEPHFQAFLPLHVMIERVRKGRSTESRLQEAVLESLRSAWSLIGVLAPVNQRVVYPPTMHAPILRAAAHHWDAMVSVGPRYTVGLREGAGLWETVSNLHYVLGQVGVDQRQLRAPLPAAGLRAIIPPAVFASGP
ncbi:MAG: hypothetical protein L0271_15975 [Gemmatimonadetes bacterium]|nr:hypothetical protein [Gemmatimonadota bacterium]